MEKINKKVLILGSTGMLGHILYSYLKQNSNYIIFDISYRKKLNKSTIVLDVNNLSELSNIINKIKPDFIINCIGILIKNSKKDPSNAIFINSFFPHFLSKLSLKSGFKLIHISTDCVFSGLKGAYDENDFRDADDIYGRSKALGELINNRDLTLRTSIIGPEIKENGEGLFQWLLKQNKTVYGYENVYWSGLTTLELSKVISKILELDITGIINVTNGNRISKFKLIEIIKNEFELDFSLKSSAEKVVDKSLISSRSDLDLEIPSYFTMIRDLKNYLS